MKKALISIGIGRNSGTLPLLKGAVQDARDMHAWGAQQGFDCTLLVDDEDKVLTADAYEAFRQYLDAGTYSQIVVYFSGHGILQAPDCELWLMSTAPGNPNEVINLRGSLTNARSSGLEHVVFISDACRSLPTSLSQAAVGPGATLLPYLDLASPSPALDVYYATLPGNPAHELAATESNMPMRGLFTRCMLDALEGKVGEVLKDLDISGVMNRVVPGHPLRVWLTTTVPEAAEAESIVLRQRPEIRIESTEDKFLAQFPSDHRPARGTPRSVGGGQRKPSNTREAQGPRRLMPSRATRSRAGAMSGAGLPTPELLAASPYEAQLVRSLGEARSLNADVAVFGGVSLEFYVGKHRLEASSRGDASVLRLPKSPIPIPGHEASVCAVMLKLDNGVVVPLTVLPGYTAVVNLDGARVDSVNYVSRKAIRPDEASPLADAELDLLRSSAAQLVRSGQLSLTSAPVIAFSERPQLLQSADPILGVLAAYAYVRAGRRADWAAMVDQLREPGLPILFDMELLTVAPNGSSATKVSSGMPMLTEGWLLLDPHLQTMPVQLTEIRQHLLPSIWSSFLARGANLIRAYLSEK